MAMKEIISKVLDKETSLAKKVRMLFKEQGIMIAVILILNGEGAAVQSKGGGDGKPESKK